MSCELEDLMMSSTAKLSSCCVLVATCPELVFSCSIVVRRVLEAVLDHNNFLAVPSITKGVVLVKLPNKSDAACLHHHVYEWKVLGNVAENKDFPTVSPRSIYEFI